MKRRWIIMARTLAVLATFACLLLVAEDNEKRAAQRTRRALRREGFKTDLSDFDFSTSPEMRQRALALTRGEFSRTAPGISIYGWGSLSQADCPELMTRVARDAALVVWKQEQLFFFSVSYPSGLEPGGDLWPALRSVLSENRADLDKACDAALAGPIGFNLEASRGNAIVLPHLAAVSRLAQLLGSRAMVELHDHHREAAWTNLLAVTRLVTAWDPETVELSQLVRYGCVTTAYNVTWQALQADGWGEERLAALQREWEAVDFFKRLPESAAFSGASMVDTCRAERKEPFRLPSIPMTDVIRSPRAAWLTLVESWRRLRYRHGGTYEDERALMLYYRDRQLQLRRAAESGDWMEMRQLPGVTNVVHFSSKYPSGMICMYNSRQLALAWQAYQVGGGPPCLSQAAKAEARRRLIVTAIALERYRARHGCYPATLHALVPELLSGLPLDFMDGKPLRYRLGNDGCFVLHSVGLDCVDDSGETPPGGRLRDRPEGAAGMLIRSDTDLVWPRPASQAEAESFHDEEIKAYKKLTGPIEDTDLDDR